MIIHGIVSSTRRHIARVLVTTPDDHAPLIAGRGLAVLRPDGALASMDLVWDVEQHFLTNGPWHYQLAHLYYTPEVTAAVNRLTQQQHLLQAA